MSGLEFDYPAGWQWGAPLVLLVMAASVWGNRRRGLRWGPVLALSSLRGVALGLLVFLASRPVWVRQTADHNLSRSSAVLVDRSESMSLSDDDQSRFQEAAAFYQDKLAPALRQRGWTVNTFVFADDIERLTDAQVKRAVPDGKRSNLGGAIARALASSTPPARAIIALTDGAANENADNTKGLSALLDGRVPFIGIGFGSELGVRTLTLRSVDGPPTAAPNQAFYISAQLEMAYADQMPEFDLVFLRDGQFSQKKTVQAGKGARHWLENFAVTESAEGAHTYSVQLLPPRRASLVCANTAGTAAVRITNEKELRVLYAQGALTWDYKFITLALKKDPTIKVTGLTRTSSQSVFRQNVESSGELLGGFPTKIEEMAPFRVVVMSNLRPPDLSLSQQELLARFCGELGGGVLMVGGTETFDFSWQGSRLEKLLPVVFASSGGVQGLDRPFRIHFTEETRQHPVFQLSDQGQTRPVLERLPVFSHYGRVDAAKPGAQVWAVHPADVGPNGPRILMASQRYGAGLSAILCVQNFWRWRLAKESEAGDFDRFWRQLFRYLGESSRHDVAIHFAEQELRPERDIHVVLERQPAPSDTVHGTMTYQVRVQDGAKKTIRQESLDLAPARPVPLSFRADKAGLYTVTVSDSLQAPVAVRTLEIKDVNVEFERTARNMELLRQWAGISDGIALKAEECDDGADLLSRVQRKVDQAMRRQVDRLPVGINPWVLSLLVGALSLEWVLRKRWALS